jgi:hypothetical protein
MSLNHCFVHGEQQIKFNIMFFCAVIFESKLGLGCLILRFQISRTHTHIYIFSTTPLNEWSACCRGCYLHNTHTTNTRVKTSMPPKGFEPMIPAIKRTEAHAIDYAATGISLNSIFFHFCCHCVALKSTDSTHK